MKAIADIKLLVVEDDPFFRRVLQKRLATDGYQVFLAGDGREGMKAIVTHEPDLVISDWMMPEVDGLELCQSVKTGLRDSAPYFILLTAKGDIDAKLLGLETGADDYLVKPCDQGELMARIRAGLRIVLLTQDLRRVVAELKGTNQKLNEARAEVRRLSDMPAICPGCRSVLVNNVAWLSIDDYLASRDPADIGHGLCPECRATGPNLRTSDAADDTEAA